MYTLLTSVSLRSSNRGGERPVLDLAELWLVLANVGRIRLARMAALPPITTRATKTCALLFVAWLVFNDELLVKGHEEAA